MMLAALLCEFEITPVSGHTPQETLGGAVQVDPRLTPQLTYLQLSTLETEASFDFNCKLRPSTSALC